MALKKQINNNNRISPSKKTGYEKTGLIFILLLTAVFYYQIREFSFIYYDDNTYITNNPDIQDLSIKGLKKIFINPLNPDEIRPPLTIFSLAVNYAIGGLNPKGYFLGNLFFHLINIVLVYFLILKICNCKWAGLFTAAVFAFHPSNSEAIAWATARKEVLFTVFFLSALYLVIRFWEKRNWWLYAGALIAFLLSYLSKYSAITFPALYIALAFLWKKRKDVMGVLIESVPFFVLPVFSILRMFFPGIFSFKQEVHIDSEVFFFEELPSVVMYSDFNFLQKIFLGGYSFFTYLGKFFFPFNQQLIYPYPHFTENGYLPTQYYIFTVLSIIIFIAMVVFFIKRPQYLKHPIGFATIFYFINISLLLHILPIGGRVVIADRYTYLPFIGMGLLFFFVLKKFNTINVQTRAIAKITGIGYIILLMFLTNSRIPDWENTGTIFEDLAKKEPNYPISYNNLGVFYSNMGNSHKAVSSLDKAIELQPLFAKAILNRGTMHWLAGNEQKAKEDFIRYTEIMPNEAVPHHHIASIYENEGNYEMSLKHYYHVLEIDSNYYLAWYNIGLILIRFDNIEEGAYYINRALEIHPEFSLAYNARGVLANANKNTADALNDFDLAIKYDSTNIFAYLNKGDIYLHLNKSEKAVEMYSYILENIELNTTAYFGRGLAYLNLNEIGKACENFNSAQKLGLQEVKPYIDTYCQ